MMVLLLIGFATWPGVRFRNNRGVDLPHSVLYRLAYAEGADVVIGAEFSGRLHVFSAKEFRKLRDFEVTFDFGGNRVAASPRFPLAFCGCHERTGLGAYDHNTGKEVWRVKPLRQFQNVTADYHTPFVFANCETGPAHVIDVVSGRVVDQLPRCRNIYCSPLEPVYLIEARGRYEVQGPLAVRRFTIESESFAILDAGFGPNRIVLTESGADVRLFDLDLEAEVGRYSPPSGSHVLNVVWSESLERIVMIEWPYEHGGNRVLKSFDPATREVESIATLPENTNSVFLEGGTRLFTTEGDIVGVNNGKITRAIDLPRATKKS